MKPKTLIPLFSVFAVLVALVFLRQSGEEPVSIVEQAELKPLVPVDLDVDSVNRIEIYAGVAPAERVVLTRDEDRWRIASHYDALANKGRAQQLLDAVKNLKGEFRAAVSDEQLADYNLSDDRGFHTVGLDGDERNVIFHLITGKSPKYGNMFMRTVDSSDVYLVDHNLRRDAYNYSLEWDDKPTAPPWVDKAIVQLPGDDFTRFELTMPDKTLVVERREKATEESAEGVDESAEEGEASPAVPAEPEYEWVVVEGGREGDIHQTPFSDLSRYLANLAADAVVDPEKKSIWGLDEPKYFLTAHRENGEKVELTGGRPNIGNPCYLVRTDNNNETIYVVGDNVFNALFAPGGRFYDLPGLLLEEATIDSVTYESFDGPVELAKVDDLWQVVTPETDLKPNREALKSMERTLSSWQAADYADPSFPAGFANSTQSITFGNGTESHTITLGTAAKHVEGRYARLDDSLDKLVMNQSDFEAVFLPYGEIFSTDLMDLRLDEEIVSIEMTKAGDVYSFTLKDDVWTASHGEDSFIARTYAANELIEMLDDLESTGIQLPDARTNGAVIGGYTVTTDRGNTWTLEVQEQVDGEYPVIVNGSATANIIDQRIFNSLFPDLETFRPDEGEDPSVEVDPSKPQPVVSLPRDADPHAGHNH